jgi:hypothetical protein
MKKTGLEKVVKRTPYTILYKINVLSVPPYKEQVAIRDFTSKHLYYG